MRYLHKQRPIIKTMYEIILHRLHEISTIQQILQEHFGNDSDLGIMEIGDIKHIVHLLWPQNEVRGGTACKINSPDNMEQDHGFLIQHQIQ